MKLRDRDEARPTRQPEQGPESEDQLAQLREAADSLIAAGDEAIERALMVDSEAFLEATRQHGGQ